MRRLSRRGAPGVSAVLSLAFVLATMGDALALDDGPRASSDHAVTVEPLTFDADIAERDQELLSERFEEGLTRVGFRPTDGSSLRVRTVITKQEGDYRVHAMVVDDGETQASLEETCELCGIEELGELLTAMGARLRRKVDLTRDAAVLRVETRPGGADVRIDGVLVGTTPVELSVEPGPHSLEIDKPGHRSERRTIDAVGGARENHSFVLRRAGHRLWLPWVLLGTGVVGIATGGTLIGIDGREIRSDCNADPAGNCQFIHKTLGGGVALTVVGVGLLATGVVLAVKWRSKGSGYARRPPRFELVGTGLRGSF